MGNIGKKPTVGEGFPVGIEVHLFEFDRDIYEQDVRVEFLEWIRPDIKFDSLAELIAALDGDRKVSLTMIEAHYA